jgi:hypothetical protein
MRSDEKKIFLRAFLLSCVFAILLAAHAAISLAFDSLPFGGYIRWISSFACLGFLIGGIYLFDGKADKNSRNRPGWRAFIGGISGIAVSLIWQWPSGGIVLSMMLGTFLGLLGFAWAKYVDF